MKKTKHPTEPAGAGSRYNKIGDFDVPEEERIALAHEALGEIGAGLDTPLIIKKSDVLELRGTLGMFPVRIVLPQIGWMTIELIVAGHWPLYRLEYDRDRTPGKENKLDPLWDDMDERGVFLAPGVFFKGRDADRIAASFLKLPVEFVQRVVQTMAAEEIRYLDLRPNSFFLQYHRSPPKMDDLVKSARNGLSLLRESASVLGAARPQTLHPPKSSLPPPLRCRYCSGWFFPVNGNLHCVNCGAPYDSGEGPA